MRIPLSAPDITEAEIEAVTAVLRTPSLSQGPRLAAFEDDFAKRLKMPHAVAVSSGTAGLHLCLRGCGIGPGDEVITSPLSFVASANAILYQGAVPVFVDIEPTTLNIDPRRIEAAITSKTRAILVVHLFGRPAAIGEILEIARRRRLKVIEDACEALGAELDGRLAGTAGDCGVFGFYPNKQITTGEGGMIVTADGALASLCRSMGNHGRDEKGAFVRLGYNYRLSDVACALGSAQLQRLDTILAQREAVAHRYQARLGGRSDLLLPAIQIAGGRLSWFVYVVRLGAAFTQTRRDWIVSAMRRKGIGCQRYFAPLHLEPHLRSATGHLKGDFPVAEDAGKRTIALPFFNRIGASEIGEVCDALESLMIESQERGGVPDGDSDSGA